MHLLLECALASPGNCNAYTTALMSAIVTNLYRKAAEVVSHLKHASNGNCEGGACAIPETFSYLFSSFSDPVFTSYHDALLNWQLSNNLLQVPYGLWRGVLVRQQSVTVCICLFYQYPLICVHRQCDVCMSDTLGYRLYALTNCS